MNSADVGTRGFTVSQVHESDWLNGLAWLKKSPSNWPKELKPVDDDDIVPMTNPSESVLDWSTFGKIKRSNSLVDLLSQIQIKGTRSCDSIGKTEG